MQYSLYLPESLVARVDELASISGRSRSFTIRELITKALRDL